MKLFRSTGVPAREPSHAHGRTGYRWMLLGLLLFATCLNPCLAGNPKPAWTTTLSDPKPGSFPAAAPFSAKYSFGWNSMTAAEALMTFTSAGDQHTLETTVKTLGLVRNLFAMDVTQKAVSASATLQPLSLQQEERYKNETISTKLQFSAEGVTRERLSSIDSPGNGKKKRFKFAPAFDPFTAYLWLRSQPLNPGDTFRLVVYQTTDPYLVEFKILERTPLTLHGQSIPTLKIDAKIQQIKRSLELVPVKKFKRATAWISDDKERLLVRAETETFVGGVWMERQNASEVKK